MTTAWLIAAAIAAIVLVSFLLGVLSAALVYQRKNYRDTEKRMETRIQSLGAQLRYLPKRKTDRKLLDEESA